MANTHRRNLDANFKTKVVLETLKGQKTVAQICSAFSIHPNQVSQWKQQVLAGIPTLLGQQSISVSEDEQELLTAPLFQQIGQVEVDFLKKN